MANIQMQMPAFSVATATSNLPPSESLNQIMDNLNHLNMIVHEAVNTISFRIKQESELLSSISKRVDAAYQKTALIASNQHRSTTIYAPSCFPTGQQQSVQNTEPLINKLDESAPNTAARGTYQLSLKQRNERAENIETVSMLQSINVKTNSVAKSGEQNDESVGRDGLATSKIPDWVSSVADCMVFDTNRNAYDRRCRRDAPTSMRRRVRKYAKKRGQMNADEKAQQKALAAAPTSIADPWYNAKQRNKTYGDRIRYVPESPRKTMPRFEAQCNMLLDDADGMIANDIGWSEEKNDDDDGFILPTDVLKQQFGEEMDDCFEFGDEVEPPPMIQAVETQQPSPAKKREIDDRSLPMQRRQDSPRDDKVERKPFAYPTPQPMDIVVDDMVDSSEHEFQNEREEEQMNEDNRVQPVSADVGSQREWLPMTQQEDENKEVESENVVEDERKRPFDAAALQDAKDRLKRQEEEKSPGRNKKDGDENSMQQRLFKAMAHLRQFHVDSDEESPSDSD